MPIEYGKRLLATRVNGKWVVCVKVEAIEFKIGHLCFSSSLETCIKVGTKTLACNSDFVKEH